jgi:hypothetical protein
MRRILRSYFEYYERSRTHLALNKDAPVPRAIQPPEMGEVIDFHSWEDFTTDMSDGPPENLNLHFLLTYYTALLHGPYEGRRLRAQADRALIRGRAMQRKRSTFAVPFPRCCLLRSLFNANRIIGRDNQKPLIVYPQSTAGLTL